MGMISDALRRFGPGAVAGEGTRVRAVWNGTVIAESDATVVVEGNHYFPPESVNRDNLRASDRHTVCFWKGTASYYDLVVGDDGNPAGAWCYPHPSPAAEKLKDRVAFGRGVRVEAVQETADGA